MDKRKLTNSERELVEGMEEFLADLKKEGPLPEKYTCRSISLDMQPRAFSAAEVRATRDMLSASQSVFAQFLGVSVKTVRAWETGKTPSEMACRFLDEIRRNPAYWRNRLQQSSTPQANGARSATSREAPRALARNKRIGSRRN